jgi:autotransporter-associated beta strand protein
LGIDNALPYGASAGNVVFGTSANNNTAILDLNGHNAQINGLTGGSNATISNGVAGAYVLTVGNNDQTSTFGGVIKNTAGTVALTKTGSGALTLSGANTYSGGTTIKNGSLVISNGNDRLLTTSTVTLGDGASGSGKLVLGEGTGARNQTLADLTVSGSGTGNAVVGGNATASMLTLTIASDSTYSGLLGGALANENNLALTKSGSAVLTLTGTNTYTGNTTVSNGTLTVSVGALNTGNNGSLNISPASGATAVVNVVNGILNLGNSQAIKVGTVAGGTAILNISGNSSVINGVNGATQRDMRAGDVGFGVININGGSVTNGGFLVAGFTTAGAVGIVNMSGGTYINNPAWTLATRLAPPPPPPVS